MWKSVERVHPVSFPILKSGIKMSNSKLLIVDDDNSFRAYVRFAFCREYEVLEAKDGESALKIFEGGHGPEVTILDLGLPPLESTTTVGLKVLQKIIRIEPATKVLVVTGHSERVNALKAIELGASDFFTKPVDLDGIRNTIKRAFYTTGLQRENKARSGKLKVEGMIGESAPMRVLLNELRKVAAVDVPVLLLGKTGTGKELAARAIHRMGNRRDGPFTAINCGAIPENLIESELFGHEKGAFTGAHTMREGRIELTEGGILFLDEVAELPPPLQTKLLRFLQDHQVIRVGGRVPKHIDVRVIAATNKDIRSMVEEGSFREDLYFRLEGVTLVLPPLKERGDDINALALDFLKKYERSFNKKGFDLTDEAVSAIRNHPWPGNVRELENRMLKAVAMAETGKITPEDLSLSAPAHGMEKRDKERKRGLLGAKMALEERMLHKALLKNRGVANRAAAELDISRQYLSDLMTKYGIKSR